MNDHLRLVSVVVTTRNRRKFLEEAIASVLSQDYQPFELIVVDDASTDETGAFLESIADSRYRFVLLDRHHEKSLARNEGLSRARGDLVMFLDDDDRLREGTLSVLAPPLFADQEAVASVGGRFRFIDGESRGFFIRHPSEPKRLRIQDDLLAGWSSVSGQNLYRTSVVRAVGGYDSRYRLCQDRDLWLRVASRGPVLIRPEVALDYRIHPGQTAKSGVVRIRMDVYSRFIGTLPRDERRRGLRLARSGQDRARAQELLRQHRRLPAFLLALRSIARNPHVLRSPLLGSLTLDVLWSTAPPAAARLLPRFVRRLLRGNP